MQNYQFSMEKVLDWRVEKEDSAQRVVKEKDDILRQENSKLDHLVLESQKLKSKNLFHSSVDHLKRHGLYKDLLDEKIIKQRLDVEKAEKAVENARLALKKAHKDKKVMEKLDEKERSRHFKLIEKNEQAQLDEISTLSYGRSSIL